MSPIIGQDVNIISMAIIIHAINIICPVSLCFKQPEIL